MSPKMRRLAKLLAVGGLAAVLVTAVPAEAAKPTSATLSKTKKAVSWTGSFTLSDPSPIDGCVGGTDSPICDHFALKVDLGEGAKIKIAIPGQSATDIDLYVYTPNGILLGSSGNLPGEGESVEFTHRARYRKQSYVIEVKPYAVVPGTSYKGTATRLTLGAT
jgi:hypothetical protein